MIFANRPDPNTPIEGGCASPPTDQSLVSLLSLVVRLLGLIYSSLTCFLFSFKYAG